MKNVALVPSTRLGGSGSFAVHRDSVIDGPAVPTAKLCNERASKSRFAIAGVDIIWYMNII